MSFSRVRRRLRPQHVVKTGVGAPVENVAPGKKALRATSRRSEGFVGTLHANKVVSDTKQYRLK